MFSAVAVVILAAVVPPEIGKMKKLHPLLRFMRHAFSTPWHVRRHFSPQALRHIENAIADSERLHAGEMRFVVEAGLHPLEILTGKTPKRRALELFGQLNIWDTEHNNGVLIYLLLADRDVEIVADRGIHRLVGDAGWEHICQHMEQQFRQGAFEAGVMQGIVEIGALLSQHFPAQNEQRNELSNRPLVL